MKVRKMTADDAQMVATLQMLSWQKAYRGIVDQSFLDAMDVQKRTENWRKGILSNDPPLVRLVVEEETVIAFACGLANRLPDLIPSSDCELWAIYAHPHQSRRGAGKLLIDHFRSEMRSLGKKQFCVWVLEANHDARAFYKSQGGVIHPNKKNVAIGTQSLVEVCYEFAL